MYVSVTQPKNNKMELEEQQADHIESLLKQANNGASLADVITNATSHPSLFAFSEILSLPTINQLQGTENSAYLDLLRLFAYGTWKDYNSNAGRIPNLVPDQALKIKQLTVLTLAETNKVLSYDLLMKELDVTNVRELEDFLINECMYVGIVRGKLDQLRRRFEIQYAAGRDLRPDQLGNIIQTMTNWLTTSDNLLISIQEKVKWADNLTELNKQHKKEVGVEDAKKFPMKSQTVSRRTLIPGGIGASTLK